MLSTLDPIDKWFLERQGRFTASMISVLMTNGKDSAFGTAGIAYIKAKAVESISKLYERPELEFVKSLLYGRAQEEAAFNLYVRMTRNTSMRYFGTFNPLFLPYNEFSGGSPDTLMGEGEKVHFLAEIKSPKNPSIHFDYLNLKDQYDLYAYAPSYYAQIQFLLMITKAMGAHFVSYDDRYFERKHQLKIIEVKNDEKYQANLDIRLQIAQKKKLEFIKMLDEN